MGKDIRGGGSDKPGMACAFFPPMLPAGSPRCLEGGGPHRDKKTRDCAVAALSKSELKFHPAGRMSDRRLRAEQLAPDRVRLLLVEFSWSYSFVFFFVCSLSFTFLPGGI